MADQSLVLQFRECRELRLQRALFWAMDVQHAAEVDHVQPLEPQIAQIVVDLLRQFFGRLFGQPRGIVTAPGANFRDDRKPIAIRSEEHTSELQSLMRISYAVFCLKKKNK